MDCTGTAKGWLLQAFEAMSVTWPHAKHRLVNRALMATGPSGFDGCLNRFVPLEADVALLGFADVSELHQQRSGLSRAESHVQSTSSTAQERWIAFW